MQEGGFEVKSLQNRPTLSRWVAEYWNGFQILSNSRIVHQGGIGPIPLSEIVAYMSAVYLRDVDDRLVFIKMIQSLDALYVQHVNDKAKRDADSQRRQAKHAPRK